VAKSATHSSCHCLKGPTGSTSCPALKSGPETCQTAATNSREALALEAHSARGEIVTNTIIIKLLNSVYIWGMTTQSSFVWLTLETSRT
jgi:hypothetical protein